MYNITFFFLEREHLRLLVHLYLLPPVIMQNIRFSTNDTIHHIGCNKCLNMKLNAMIGPLLVQLWQVLWEYGEIEVYIVINGFTPKTQILKYHPCDTMEWFPLLLPQIWILRLSLVVEAEYLSQQAHTKRFMKEENAKGEFPFSPKQPLVRDKQFTQILFTNQSAR